MMFNSLSGQTLGKYELRDLLGSGGMGAVYRGYDHALRREVAVKVINLAAGGADLQARFIREAQTSAALEHNHIVRIYDYGVERDINYVVMQYLTGGSLAERIKQAADQGRPRASLTEVAALLQHLASALDYAHKQGVVHRDIKPANVMFNNQGQAFIVDFGIAKLLTGATNLTGTNMAMGTPSYMPPEQWSQRDLTPAADQYALAVTTYQLVSGRLPFEADSVPSLWYKIENDQPTPLHILRPDIPHEAMLVINRAMGKIPAERFPNCTQFAQAFEAATYGAESGATEYFTFKLARPASAVSRTPTPQTPGGSSGSGTPPPSSRTPSIAVTPPVSQPRGGFPRGLLIVGALAIVALLVVAAALLGGRGPSESDLRLTEVNQTLVAVGLATASEATRQSGLELIVTETATDSPTDSPSPTATDAPTDEPTRAPSETPTDSPTSTPTATATDAPSATPTDEPTATATISAREAALATLDTAATMTATQWTPTWTPDFDATVRAELTAVFVETQIARATARAEERLVAQQTQDASATAETIETLSADQTRVAQQTQVVAATERAQATVFAQQTLDAAAIVSAEQTAAAQAEFDAQATGIAEVTLSAQQTLAAAATVGAEQTAAAQVEFDARATGIAQATVFAQQTLDAAPTITPTIGPEGGLYHVQAGDTIASIAVRFNVSVLSLMAANQITADASLYVGRPLFIPARPTPAPTRTPTTPPELRPTSTPSLTPAPRVPITLGNASQLAEVAQIQPPGRAAVYSAKFSPDGTRIVYGTSSNEVVVYSFGARRNIRSLSGHDTTVVSTVWSPDGTRVASGDGNGKVYVWDVENGERVLELVGHTSTVFGLAYSGGGAYIASGSNDDSVRVWDAYTGRLEMHLGGSGGTIYKTMFSNDGSRVVAVSSDRRVRVWDWRNNRLISETELRGFVGALAFNPDGDTYATGADGPQSGEVHLWSLSTYAPFRVLQVPEYVLDVAFSPDGSLLASVGWDDTLHVFDWRSGAELAALSGHTADVQAVDFSPNGTLIVTSAEDGTIRLWGIP
ncbi:MAG: protein kinase [Chloroflexi bacterium]|nr:protein kinase [Chloroflexota bacterium]